MFKHASKLLLVAGLSGAIALTGCSNSNGSSSASTGSIGDQVKHKIVGIDPGAGLMKQTEKALEDYELSDWNLVEGSSAAMAAALDKAYKDKEPIIVTGWTPHWMFAKYDLKYLEDPKGSYGQDEEIHTIVRNGFKEDAPSAYAMLDRFEWTPDEMAVVMNAVADGTKPEEAAAQWVKDHADKVDAWVKDLPQESGKKVKLAYVAWDSEIASTNVVKQVLEQRLGYKVEMLQVEAGPMWAGIANGSADAIVAAWLPTTHQDYYDKYQGQFEDLGANLIGTKLGLVVPSYMDITSIEDLKTK
ncbi:glycine betaine/proline transport system substrate-binding protein [Paenibacillus cellulosilyticus]|uniref:Glycine betaine/proline transport system substrate-binding protein n=1 Tax=Paenibacillus cellulosilyticus TaxID=375489 RepID=A0A2V2Z0C6_9BACL|nr:glycine betaine ABC transporter substrate-binding protein [Paenibacillus cellulosilyticus]PWW08733.1 glycine betaine/proline transport system substrate-binding protein [Paenibacillus cellulosilyticus]QKS48296.1 glycine/betaine ABC transporter [Paenibacillus cellulosilyticus]